MSLNCIKEILNKDFIVFILLDTSIGKIFNSTENVEDLVHGMNA